MNQQVQHKIEEFKRLAKSQKEANNLSLNTKTIQSSDGLSKVIRNQYDADLFTVELKIAIKQAH